MKTMKMIAAISLGLILVYGSTAALAGVKPVSRSTADKSPKVHYCVRLDKADLMVDAGRDFVIMMTDGQGRQVAPAQLFVPYKADYNFSEGGTVRGTRMATAVQVPMSPKTVMVLPAVQTGVFYPNASYLFVIRVIPLVSAEPARDIR